MQTDEFFMREAIRLAELARGIDEVPVGALIVRDGEIISTAYNTRESSKCATHHAEILAIEEACRRLGGWRLPGVTLYVTMEPCAMCAGAIINARIDRVFFGASDPKSGSAVSVQKMFEYPYNYRPEVASGVMEEECSGILTRFFKELRERKIAEKGKK